ncbi:MAG: tyrosine-type recombinase/integrase [Ktedonobacteraceae bacterium]
MTLLSRGSKKREGKRQRKRKYDQAVLDALLIVWKAAYRVCSKRLIPFMPVLVEALIRHGHLDISETVKEQLLSVSPATADRLLKPERRKYGKGISTTKPGYLIKKHIPIQTFTAWNDVVPGFMEADLVAHCGENVRGQFLHTLTVTDIATGWTELGALMGKGESDVLQEIADIKESLPFPLLGFDTDNGGEFINYGLVEWCSQNNITFTRSREYKKNDQAHVEQKNGSIVRQLIGYDRYEGIESWQLLSQLYRIARLYINFFQPCLKLISKWRDGARVHKRYDTAKTPYQRILLSPSVTDESKERLRKVFPTLDPILLLQEMERLQIDLWKTAVGQDQAQQIEDERNQNSQSSVDSGTDGTTSEPTKLENMAPCTAPTPSRKRAPGRKGNLKKRDKLPSETTDQHHCLPVPAELYNDSVDRKALVTSGLALLVDSFLDHLENRKASLNTINSYRDSLRLLLQFAQRHLGKQACQLELTDIDATLVAAFLDDMEARGISAGSRNLRLTAIRTFFRYATAESPVQSDGTEPILALRTKQYARPAVEFLTPTEVEALLKAPDRTTWTGRRDHAFLLLAVTTGLLVSEMTKLRRQNVELGTNAHIRIIGKGRRQRQIPLATETQRVLQDWMQEQTRSKMHTLFPNARGGHLTDDGARFILIKHAGVACELCPSLQDKRITTFLLRHTAAMQLLQSGMNREQLALWLGLESVDSTQPYISADLSAKKKLAKDQRISNRAP